MHLTSQAGNLVVFCSCGWKVERPYKGPTDDHAGKASIADAKQHRADHPDANVDWFLAVPAQVK